jgi:hypothetical protein
MRKLIVAAATAATVSTLGLTATAQALSVSQGAGRATAAVSKTAVAGIPKNAPIKAFLPQDGSGTLSFWETALGITPGPCVSNVNNTLEENEGVNKVLQSPNAIFIYSVGDFIAQSQHSATCVRHSATDLKAGNACKPNTSGVVCVHVPGKNWFFCDEHGTMKLGAISGVSPTVGKGAS